jgi:hypothetical protein
VIDCAAFTAARTCAFVATDPEAPADGSPTNVDPARTVARIATTGIILRGEKRAVAEFALRRIHGMTSLI